MMIDYLRELNLASVFLRLTLAMFFGGMIGIEREKKRRPAGFRTYMLVCLGATLTMIIGQYEHTLLTTVWADLAGEIGLRSDVSRIGRCRPFLRFSREGGMCHGSEYAKNFI